LTTISGPGIGLHDSAGLYRTPDGTLHVAMTHEAGSPLSIDVAHVSGTGALTGRSTAVSGWATLREGPVLVGAPGGGMRMVFGGRATSTPSDPYSEGYAYLASSDATGAAWTLAPNTTPAIKSPSAYLSYGTGATTLADGTVVAAYAYNSTITYQVGNGAPESFTVEGCCAFNLAVVNDGGTVGAAWYANGTPPAGQGTFVRELYPTLGPVLQAPGSVTAGNSHNPGQPVALAARSGGGVFVAYLVGWPGATKIGLWKVGDAAPKVVKVGIEVPRVALSAGADGRLWLAFVDHRRIVHVAQTDPGATKLGELQLLTPPKGADVEAVGIEGTTGHADVVVKDTAAFLHTQVRYGLTLKAKPGSLKAGKPGTVKFKVTDAGDAVKGVKVRAKGRSCRTDKHGRCSITFPALKGSGFAVHAKARHYALAVVRIKLKG
jgi:hypothetical protein